jgi:hypothetical protein
MNTQIEQLVSQLTGNATMFTAFDITMMLRRESPTTNIRHGEVRDIVHSIYTTNNMDGYIRSLQDVNGNNAYVYHPYGTNAEDYDAFFLSTKTTHSLTHTPVVVNQMTTNSQVGNKNKPKRARYSIDSVPKDKFGRLRIPASVVRAAGFSPKDKVYVVLDPNLITITSDAHLYGKKNGKKYVVDVYNNIRVHLRNKFKEDNFKMVFHPTKQIYITPV